MEDYVRIYETSNASEANVYVKAGWDLIDTSKAVQYDGDGSYIKYTLGLPSKEYANQLLEIIREYEQHGLKEVLYEKIIRKQNDNDDVPSRARNFLIKYADVVDDKKIVDENGRIDDKYIPYDFENVDF